MARLYLIVASVVLLACGRSSVLAQSLTPAQQLENMANLAEKMSDRQQEKYCQRFGAKFGESEDVWADIQKSCIDTLVFDRSHADLPANFPVINEEMSGKVKEIHAKCAAMVKNPCLEGEWKNVKSCIRREGIATDVLNAGKSGGAMPKNMASLSLNIASSIFDCTAKKLESRR